jgi:hypothetical protein
MKVPNNLRIRIRMVADLPKPACLVIYGMGCTLESSHIAIRKDTEAVLRLMNSTGCLEVDRRLCSTTAINTVLQSLQFLCPHLGFEFLGLSASTLPKLTGIFLSHSQGSSPPRSQPSSKQFLSDAMPASPCIRPAPAPRAHGPPVRLRLRTLTHE